jgi:hypothetical protein
MAPPGTDDLKLPDQANSQAQPSMQPDSRGLTGIMYICRAETVTEYPALEFQPKPVLPRSGQFCRLRRSKSEEGMRNYADVFSSFIYSLLKSKRE